MTSTVHIALAGNVTPVHVSFAMTSSFALGPASEIAGTFVTAPGFSIVNGTLAICPIASVP